jgi:hypothetical protein
MIRMSASKSPSPNEELVRFERHEGEDNVGWLRRVLDCTDLQDHGAALLLGGRSTTDFRLRAAQAHARSDLNASFWSHLALLEVSGQDPAASIVHEISLSPPNGFGYPPVSNALQSTPFARYASVKDYPNIALLRLPVAWEKIQEGLKQFALQRPSLDAVELLVAWLAFVWGVGSTPNPLLSGMGIPSASMVEAVVSFAGFELTPGMPSRSSCPEAVWQSAKWWHEYYKKQDKNPLTGCWYVGHEY